jgi:succinoglycan biosynthesis transport protein ExoP
MSSFEKDERLLPLPIVNDIQLNNPQDIPANYSPIYDDEVFGEGRSLKDYFLVVYKRLPIILALTILVTAVVAFYMYRLPSIYEAQTVMIIEPPKAKATQKDSVYINFGYDGNYVNTQLRLLYNPELMRAVVIQLGLHKDPDIFKRGNKGLMESLRSIFGADKDSESKDALPVLADNASKAEAVDINTLSQVEKDRADAYAAMLLGALKVEMVNGTDVVNLTMNSTNPDLIPRVLNTLADVHIKKDGERALQGGQDVYKDLSKSIEDLKASIAQQEAQRLAEMSGSGIPLTDGKGNDFQSIRLSTLSSQFLEAEDERRKIQAEYESASASIARGEQPFTKEGIDFINAARENILKMKSEMEKRADDIEKQIQDAEAERGQLLVRYTPEFSKVKEIEVKIARLKENKEKTTKEIARKIDQEEKTLKSKSGKEVLTNLQSRLAAAQRREAQLRATYQAAVGNANQMGVAETKLITLTSEISTNRNLLSTYTQRQKEMELTISGLRPDNMLVSTYALKPEAPIGPQRNRNIFIAFFLTFALGVGLAFLLDYLDDSVKTSDDVGKYLGLPTLALIPHQSLIEKRRKGALPKNAGLPAQSSALMTLEDNRSAMAEAYRHLRTSLLFSSAGKPPQTVLITSSQPSEGKTTTAINTAITLAQAGADVVIIDCDLRRPRLHHHFAMANDTGLTNYLSGERNLLNLLKPYPGFPRLKVITSGPIPPNPAELLSSGDMKDLIRDLKGKFKHIVIDSPPAISFTDAAILSTLTDGVILVAMSGKSSIQLIKRFKQRLNSIGARIYGVVLNGIKPDSFEYGYYGYGYEYGYDDDDDDSTPRMEDGANNASGK